MEQAKLKEGDKSEDMGKKPNCGGKQKGREGEIFEGGKKVKRGCGG